MALAGAEARVVEETVRRYFSAGASGDGVAMTVGPLRDVLSLLRELQPEGRRTAFELRRLKTTTLRDGAAELDLLAVERVEQLGKRRPRRWTARYTGPVRLRRVEDEWKIADYRYDGRSLVESFRVVEAEPRERRGIRFRPRAVLLHRRATVAFFELENRRAGELELRCASTSLCYCSPTPSLVPPGGRLVARVSWPKRISLQRGRLRGRLLARERRSREPFEFGWLVDRDSGTGSATLPRRASLMLRLYGSLGDTGLLVAFAVVPPIVAWVALGGRGAHGVLPYSAGSWLAGALSMLGHGRRLRAGAFALGAFVSLVLWSLTPP